jgi:hypothetical protein
LTQDSLLLHRQIGRLRFFQEPSTLSVSQATPQELAQSILTVSLYAMRDGSHRSGEKYQDRHYQS